MLPVPSDPTTIDPRNKLGDKVKSTLSDGVNPLTEAVTSEPTGPWLEFNDRDCALANGAIVIAIVNILRKSIASITLLNLFSILISLFCKWTMPFPNP